MAVTELLPTLQSLQRFDKLRVIQFLAFELTKEEDVDLAQLKGDYPIWTSYNAFETADTLLNVLAMDQGSRNGFGL